MTHNFQIGTFKFTHNYRTKEYGHREANNDPVEYDFNTEEFIRVPIVDNPERDIIRNKTLEYTIKILHLTPRTIKYKLIYNNVTYYSGRTKIFLETRSFKLPTYFINDNFFLFDKHDRFIFEDGDENLYYNPAGYMLKALDLLDKHIYYDKGLKV